MTELKYYKHPVVDCADFDRFVEEVYGRRYSTVSGYRGNDMLGHYTYHTVDVEQWKYDKEYNESEEHKQWVKEFEEKYGSAYGIELEEDRPSFEEWSTFESIHEQHNNSPVIDEVVYHLIKDGHDVPARFTVLVDW